MKNQAVSLVKILIIVLVCAVVSGDTVSKAQGRGNQKTDTAGGRHLRQSSPKDPFLLSTPPDRPQVFRVPAFVDEPPATFISSPEPPGLENIQALEIPTIARAAPTGRVFGLDEQTGIITQQGEMPLLAATPAVSFSFDSLDFDDNGSATGFVFIPPDPIAAAGPNHVVNVINVMVAFYQKDGTEIFTDDLEDFFADPSGGGGCAMNLDTFPFDPKVIYDQYEDRFLIVVLEQTDTPRTSRIFLAASTTSDPTDPWICTVINSNVAMPQSHFADYPGFAVDDQAVYITANMFRFGFETFGGVRLWIVDKGVTNGFYNGQAASVELFDPYAAGVTGIEVTTQPAHMFGTAPANVGTFLVSYSGLSETGGGGDEAVQVVRVDDPLGTPTFTQEFVFVNDIEDFPTAFPDAPQLGGATPIETNDRRALHAVWRDDSLWMTTTIVPKSGDDDAGEATAHWFQLNTSPLSPITLLDQGNIGGEDIAPQTHTFFPAIAVNSAGDVAIGFSASGQNIFPGSYYTFRQPVDDPGITNGSEVLRAGLDRYVRTFGGARNRWGDYSGIAVDPADQCFWVYNEHAILRDNPPTSDDGLWGTAYEYFCPPCSQSFDLTANQWKQIALPCDVGTSNTVADVIGDDLTGEYGTAWRLFKWNGTSYEPLTTTSSLVVGEGYWIKTANADQSVAVEGSLNAVIEVPLFPLAEDAPDGVFTQVGQTQNFEVCWKDVEVVDGANVLSLDQADPGGACQGPDPQSGGCIMSRLAYKWTNGYQSFDGKTLGMEGTLESFDGLWVKAFKAGLRLRIPKSAARRDCTTVIAAGPATGGPTTGGPRIGGPATGGPGIGRPATGGPIEATPEGWFVRLIAEAGNLRDAGNVLGQLPDSVNGYDLHDLKELAPFASPYLTIVFPHPDWDEQAGDYTSDFHALQRRPNDQWSFEVMASDPDQEVTLRWEGAAALLERTLLIDQETGATVPVQPDGSYTFTINGTSQAFWWLAGRSRPRGRP